MGIYLCGEEKQNKEIVVNKEIILEYKISNYKSENEIEKISNNKNEIDKISYNKNEIKLMSNNVQENKTDKISNNKNEKNTISYNVKENKTDIITNNKNEIDKISNNKIEINTISYNEKENEKNTISYNVKENKTDIISNNKNEIHKISYIVKEKKTDIISNNKIEINKISNNAKENKTDRILYNENKNKTDRILYNKNKIEIDKISNNKKEKKTDIILNIEKENKTDRTSNNKNEIEKDIISEIKNEKKTDIKNEKENKTTKMVNIETENKTDIISNNINENKEDNRLNDETLFIIIKEDFSNQPELESSSENNAILVESNGPKTINEINFRRIEPMSEHELKDLYSNQPSMCKINFQKEEGSINHSSGTGFFCEINDDNIPFKKALFTNNHVLNENSIKINKDIEFECMGKKNKIQITENRKIFTSIELDYTCIEIFETDKINNNNFFRIDKNIFNNKNGLIGTEILILQYPKSKELSFAKGEILNIEEEDKILHNASTQYGSSGSPLIKRYNNNLILGIHFGKKKMKNSKNITCNIATPFDFIIKDIISQTKSINIEIIDSSYMCKIYSGLNKKFNNLGIFIKIPLSNSNNTLSGILTKYFIEDYILNDIKEIKISDKDEINKIKLNNNFTYSDLFLDATFIEIKNSEYDFIEINEGDILPKNSPLLIKYAYSNNSINYDEVEIIDQWGINIFYKEYKNEFDFKYLFDYNSSYSKLALLSIIAKAIKLNFENNLRHINQRGKPLSKEQIEELKRIGLEESTIPNIFVSPPCILITPIWFLRTKYAWYWTPTKPDNMDITKSNWMIIYPGNSLKVIGGEWNNIEPAPNNINFIHWLENNGLRFLF